MSASRLVRSCPKALFLLGSLLASLASASPLLPFARDVPVADDTNLTRAVTAEDFHATVLSQLDPSKIITSADLGSAEFLASLAGVDDVSARTFYSSDLRSFITLDASPIAAEGNDTLEARESCYAYNSNTFLFGHAYWSPWQHMTDCLQTYAGAGGSLYYSKEKSISTTFGGGYARRPPISERDRS